MTPVTLREFTMPDVGEGLTEAEIVTWQVEPGDTVTVNQVICEIETAAGMSISDIFAQFGEAYFRDGERRVIARLLGEGPKVMATGGGAFMNAETRERIAASGISVWLRADLDTLMMRVSRRDNRPLLKSPDPRAVMEKLIGERYPVYALADVTVDSRDVPHEVIVEAVLRALHRCDKLAHPPLPQVS